MRLLDLAFCNDPGNVIMFESPVSIIPTDRHHKPYVLCVEVHSNSSPTDCTGRFDFVLDYSKCNFDLIAAAFDSTNWEFIGANDNVNVAVDAFYRKLHSVLKQYVPLKSSPRPQSFKYVWWNSALRRLRNQLRKARKCYTKNRTEDQRRRLRSLERDFKELNDNLYRQHISRLQQNLKRDPSSFWKHFKSKRRHATIPVDISFNGVAASNLTESTNMFADFFQSVFSSADYETDSNYLASIQSHDVNLPMPSLTEQEVFERLSTVDPSKGTGPDDIPPSVLKNCAASLAAPICHLFNRSLRERTFPNAWRIAAITPIYKSGNAHCVENYRPISILCAISKIFEVLMHERMYAAIKPFIADSQHGFVKKRSTVTNLMCYVSSLNNNLEKGCQVDSVYIDFAKAFDRVPHKILIAKMDRLGFPSWSLEWTASYLANRQAYTKIKNSRSRKFDTPSGVPQGSHLGPLLFIIFVNDLCATLQSDTLMYADDLKLYRKVISEFDCLALQTDIAKLEDWCHSNGMAANAKKCKVVNFSRSRNIVHYNYQLSGVSLENVKSIVDLGVKVDSRLTFSEHIALTAAKGFAALGFLRRNTSDFDDIYALKAIYCSSVRSIMEYAVQVWAPSQNTQSYRLERVQRSFVRYALRQLPWNDPHRLPPYEQRCSLMNLATLEKRRAELQQTLIFDTLTCRIDSSYILQRVNMYVSTRTLRQRQFLWIPYHRTAYGRNHPLDKCCERFNSVYHLFDFNMCKRSFKIAISSVP